MESLVTGLAQRDEIVRRIASGPSALNVVNIEYRIFVLPAAVLANVSVSEQYVFPHVPKSELFALLVRLSAMSGFFSSCVSNAAVSTVMAVTGKTRMTASTRDMCAAMRFSTEGASQPLRLLATRLSKRGAR